MDIGRIGHRDRAVFFRSLAVMFSVGISLYRALRLLRGHTGNIHLHKAIVGIEDAVRSGASFSEGISRYPKIFSEHIRTTMRVAESTGSLPQVLDQVAQHEESAYRTDLNIRQALIYPIWILIVVVIFVFWVPPFLFGELFAMLERSGVELPLITRAMLTMSHLASNPLFYVVTFAMVFGTVWWIRRALEKPKNRLELYRVLHRTPAIDNNLRALASCRFARAFGMMSDAGVPMVNALELAANSCNDPLLAHRIKISTEAMIAGAPVANALDQMEFFPPLFITTVEVGQETGRIGDILKRVVKLYEVELEYRSEVLLAAIEPLAMMIMGLFVGGTIAATMIPLMRLLDKL